MNLLDYYQPTTKYGSHFEMQDPTNLIPKEYAYPLFLLKRKDSPNHR